MTQLLVPKSPLEKVGGWERWMGGEEREGRVGGEEREGRMGGGC